jgi:hypothetical protein
MRRLKRAFLVVLFAAVAVTGYYRVSYYLTNRPVCPRCGAEPPDVLPIRYGLPGEEMFERSLAGEFELGGCVIDDKSPRWSCRRCEERWGRAYQRKWPWSSPMNDD